MLVDIFYSNFYPVNNISKFSNYVYSFLVKKLPGILVQLFINFPNKHAKYFSRKSLLENTSDIYERYKLDARVFIQNAAISA